MSISKWIDELNVENAYNGILFLSRKEWSINTCHYRDEPWKWYLVKEVSGKLLHIIGSVERNIYSQ